MKTVRLQITVSDDEMLTIEGEYNRLHQQLIQMKKKGVEAKNRKFRQADLLRLMLKLGLEELKKRNIEQLIS